MEHTKDDYLLPNYLIKEFIGKTRKEDAAKISMTKPGQIGIRFQFMDSNSHLVQKTVAKLRLDPIVPIAAFRQIEFGFGKDANVPHQARFRKRVSVSDQLQPAAGLAS